MNNKFKEDISGSDKPTSLKGDFRDPDEIKSQGVSIQTEIDIFHLIKNFNQNKFITLVDSYKKLRNINKIQLNYYYTTFSVSCQHFHQDNIHRPFQQQCLVSRRTLPWC